MSGKMLRAEEPADRAAAATWTIESPTPGIVLIDVAVEGARSLTPLHWRAGDWSKPPLDIEIDPMSGEIQGLQLVLQDEHVKRGGAVAVADFSAGVPVVEHTTWPEGRYRDVRCAVVVTRGNDNELVVSLAPGPVVARSGVLGVIAFGWDESWSLCELVIGPLDPRDWEDIDASSGAPGDA